MDIITLAMAKPKVLDLTKFYPEGVQGYTLNDLLMALFMESLQNGGTLKTRENFKVVANPSIKQQVTTSRDTYVIKMNAMGSELRYPVAYICGSAGVDQLSFSGIVAVPDVGKVYMNAYIQFYDKPDYVHIGAKATIL